MHSSKNYLIILLSLFMLSGCNNAGNVVSLTQEPVRVNDGFITSENNGVYSETVDGLQSAYETAFRAGVKSDKLFADNIANIKNDINTGNFDLLAKPIANNNAGVDYVDIKSVYYTTTIKLPDENKKSYDTSGAVMFPHFKDLKQNSVKGVVVYFHPTAFDKQAVPSRLGDYNKNQELMYAGLFAANGYIVVMPDYVGQGIDFKDIHPYVLYPQQNVDSAIQLLNTIMGTIQNEYKLDLYSTMLKTFSVGYSEGGAYSIWFSKCVQSYNTNNSCKFVTSGLNNGLSYLKFYDYTASIGLDGAYDLSNVVKPFLTEDVEKDSVNRFNIENVEVTNLVKPGLSMLALMSYMKYNLKYDSSEQFAKAYNSEFYNMKCTGSLNPQSGCNLSIDSVQKNLNFLQALTEEHINDTEFVQSTFKSAIYKKLEQGGVTYRYLCNIFDVFSPSKNSIDALSYKSMLDSNDFSTTMKNASITNFGSETKKPLMLFSLKHDSVVSPNSTINFVNSDLVTKVYLENNKIYVRNLLNDKDVAVDHVHGENYANIYALNFINKCVKNPSTCK